MTMVADIDSIKASVRAQISALDSLLDSTPPVVPPTEPPPPVGITPEALAEGFTTVDFFDDFDDPSTINTTPYVLPIRAPTVFVDEPSPEMNAAGKPITWYPELLQQPEDFTIANSILTIHRDRSGVGKGLCSFCYDRPHVGRAFKGSRWFEAKCAWDPIGGTGWPNTGAVFWSWDYMPGARRAGFPANLRNNPLWLGEMDFLETPNDGDVMMSMAQWYVSESPNPDSPYYNAITPEGSTSFLVFRDWQRAWAREDILEAFPDFDYREMNRYATSYKTAADNNGVGSIKRYVGQPTGPMVHLPLLDVTWTPGGLYSVFDTLPRTLIIGCGTRPAKFDYVGVWKR